MGTFVVEIATSMLIIMVTAAIRVSRPKEEEDTADDLAHPDKRGHDLRGRNPDLGETAHPEVLRVEELLDALGEKHSANDEAD
jgi:hypothetical protein